MAGPHDETTGRWCLQGSKGLKIYKSLGLHNKDKRQTHRDWRSAHRSDLGQVRWIGEYRCLFTQLIQTFWDPIDSLNERWLWVEVSPQQTVRQLVPKVSNRLSRSKDNVFKNIRKQNSSTHTWDGMPMTCKTREHCSMSSPNMGISKSVP